MELKMVTKEDYKFLYDLLSERQPHQSISHRQMPSWEQHCAFNDAKPYKRDYIIMDGVPLGRLYLTKDNEIGIVLKKEFQGIGWGSQALQKFKATHIGPLYANVSPYNRQSQQFFQHHGFRLIQLTYKLE